eukprot:CAMPEP_0194268616 /NCGR_PEP_ID=MMETSP0169-20130528/2903_1 /TAXON_ID=218684 /ORGANISM="Corethron pennatum, Strain L29A3" /LENGTH=326 /DNA_ID=CAMNT_0039009913 /DNA_START=287 /DNA_END=1267 /DNA_ORIENTATION=-
MKTTTLLVVTTAYILGRASASSSSLPFLPDAASSSSRSLSSKTNCPYDCFHNGECKSVVGTEESGPHYYCDCSKKFGGQYCQSPKVECDSDNMYCLNGGKCMTVKTESGKNAVGCDCGGLEGEPGGPFLGKHCESNPSMFCTGSNSGIFFSHSFCTNGGTCNQINVSGDLHHHGCQCQGVYTDGIYCEYESGYVPLMIHTLPPPEPIEEFNSHPFPDADAGEAGTLIQAETSQQVMDQGSAPPPRWPKARVFFLLVLCASVVVGVVRINSHLRRSNAPDTFRTANYDDTESPGAFVMGDLSLSPSGPRVLSPTGGGDGGQEEGEFI